jgi:PncC family amidohydrolase
VLATWFGAGLLPAMPGSWGSLAALPGAWAIRAIWGAAGLAAATATAESCTGGLVVGALTAIAGSSDVVERGFVTYSNEAKSELLGVAPATIAAHGAVSAETAAAMAQGAIACAPVDLAISVTGIAGPGGATPTKPVGLVLSAWRGAMGLAEPNTASSPATARPCAKRH